MSEPFIAEIKIFAGNFNPRGWAFCDGQLLPIAQNTALFSLVGTIYGGDGRTDFGLPDLRGRAPMNAGRGPGLSNRILGQRGGVENVTLSASQIPSHTHLLRASNSPANSGAPGGRSFADTTDTNRYHPDTDTTLAGAAVTNTGGSQSHNNMQPFLVLSFIIALQGLYPSRS